MRWFSVLVVSLSLAWIAARSPAAASVSASVA
jgi:hypothetical protein